MTLREKYMALLADLVEERDQFGERWAHYYDGKIKELNLAIMERWGCEDGSGTGNSTGGSAELQDVSGGAPQVVRESGDTSGTMPV